MWIKNDNNIEQKLIEIIKDDRKLEEIKQSIIKFAKRNSAEEILKKVLEE